MTERQAVEKLPAFAALDGYAVLAGQRRGASIQLDETYFEGQRQAIQHPELESTPSYRRQMLTDSWQVCNDIRVRIDSLSEEALWEESKRLRRKLQRLPETSYLSQGFPGRCVVVPEWLRTDTRLHYGSRCYLFRDGDGPEPAEILQRNIESVLDDSAETFERYQGQLHGYPECCIEFYQNRSPDQGAPEWRSVQPFADWVRDETLSEDPATLDDVFSQSLDSEELAPWFAREFFPEPGCETARANGRAIYDTLSGDVPDALVDDYFRLNFAYAYFVTQTMAQGGNRRPSAGRLGREHLSFYLPLEQLLSSSVYAPTTG